jgi:hypothetical protein
MPTSSNYNAVSALLWQGKPPSHRVAVTGMSKRVHTITAEHTPSGRTIVVRFSLTAAKIRAAKEREVQREADRARSRILLLYYYFISLAEIPA